MKNVYENKSDKDLVPLYELEIPKISKGEHTALYDLFGSVGKSPQDFYNAGKIHIDNNSVNGLFADKIGLKEIPKSIKNLENLTRLNLNENELISIPSELWTLKNLRSLGLYKNNLNSLPSDIGNLENLKDLYLYWNNIDSLPSEIWKLKNLETLGLRGNPIKSIPLEIQNLKNLKTVYLYDCPLDKDSQKLVKNLNRKGIDVYYRSAFE